MRVRSCAVASLLAATAAYAVAATPFGGDVLSPREPLEQLLPRDLILPRDEHGHHHNSHAAPLLELNETEVTMYHALTPPSYFTLDWDETDPSEKRYPGLMLTHALFMGLAFFVALPAGIALRSVKHAAHSISTIAFYTFCALGCATSSLYRKLTPNMYEGAVHSSHGYLAILFAILLSAVDIFNAVVRVINFFKGPEQKTIVRFWRYVVLKKDFKEELVGPEYTGLVEDPEEYEEAKLGRPSAELPHVEDDSTRDTTQWANDVHHHRRQFSTVSDATVFGSHSPTHSEDSLHNLKFQDAKMNVSLMKRIGTGTFAVAERSLVLCGLVMVISGIITYTGGCRENYINGCLAHLIKGGIFWSYGLLTFARFLGSFAELGWAWNIAPVESRYTAEFVESFVIFLYGITNTWMERFGANAGDPYTTKQIQHIGIAVMFWFAGLVGMGIESKRVRKWLASSTFSSVPRSSNIPQEAITEPASYRASFNPFPALVIGVTGAAMAAHFQTYLFQVQIHVLWGNLLLGFSLLRCLTYFFLWLGPPTSILPSRPPTEALGSFFLACGGLVFMFSTEELTIAAMRRGRDDVMMFLNVAVAMTCFAFCWTLCVVGFKGWLKSRNHTVTFRSSA